MARNFAQFQLRMWVDTDWTDLTVEAQHLYKLLLSQEDIGPSGLIPLRPRRWAKLSRNGSVEKVMLALQELDEASFVVVDEDTSEVLVRTFLRSGDSYKLVRLLRMALNQAERVESPRIRSALGQELAKLPAVAIPDSNGKNDKSIAEARAEQKHLDAVVSMLNDAPPDDPGHGMGSWDEPMGSGHPIITVPVTVTSTVPDGASSTESDVSYEWDGELDAELVEMFARCDEHYPQLRRNCTGCAADRKAGESA